MLGKESKWGDREIKYSVRSVEKYLQNYGKIFIIGEKPHFFNDQIIHIPFNDIYGNKARNIMCKINRSASDKRVSNKFMLFNDDYFLLKQTDAPTYPYYYKNTLKEALEKNINNYEFTQHLRSTQGVLSLAGHTLNNFDSHYPIIYSKVGVKKVIEQYNWNIPFGYIFKSLYCNTLKIKGEFKPDCKIDHPHVFDSYKNVIKDWDMFSIGDGCLRGNVKSLEQLMFSLYPNKSKYEL